MDILHNCFLASIYTYNNSLRTVRKRGVQSVTNYDVVANVTNMGETPHKSVTFITLGGWTARLSYW